jgi:Fe-S-cluster containining protein
MGTTRKPVWYAEGLRFTCRPDCGRCCSRHDDYAYLYLQDDDVAPLAAALGLDEEAFLSRFTAHDDGDLVLRMDGPACPFLDGTRCSVYRGRPTQCRTFPFWKETLRTRKTWQDLREFCPGIDEGEVHSLVTIRSRVAERKDA